MVGNLARHYSGELQVLLVSGTWKSFCIYIFTQLLRHKLYETQGQFWTDLKLEFSFSEFGCHNKINELCLIYYLTVTGGRTVLFHTFPKRKVKCQKSHRGFDLGTSCPFSTAIIIRSNKPLWTSWHLTWDPRTMLLNFEKFPCWLWYTKNLNFFKYNI